ncbi:MULTISPECIES: large conductance mechanosensitive channel protein MscL [Psychrobacter]|uniref:large conductance mechanosensitive channel protein MscL n=1 Tax=Psychrobacter TaxID=497 RepID=UPI000715EE94|nr:MULTISPECIES: large conductance mechanosensitive channel protein MscL [Psychrobacter]KRG33809.1 large-conductance mechanosensitive channel [Psychrobacter sp. P11F6]MCG3871931.1 large conductance mechanosensitive channel protein MscL [Psychrobacter sp. Ps7]HBF47365.1 large conductance mechanosensitive channel protein MscL [Shewanella frigidimarina]
MSMVSEFKEFALKGNVMDLAVGVIIGGAFATITTSLVEDIIMPIVAFIAGGEINFKNMFLVLGDAPEGVAMTYDALKAAGVPVLAYGSFITVLINFLILAFIIFMMVRMVNKMRRKEEVQELVKQPSEEVQLLREISAKLGNTAVSK